jgi:hypothetical protein
MSPRTEPFVNRESWLNNSDEAVGAPIPGRSPDASPRQGLRSPARAAGKRKTETMPVYACQFFYACEGRGALLRPLAGDCCVICSYGSAPCPAFQGARATEGAVTCCAGKGSP